MNVDEFIAADASAGSIPKEMMDALRAHGFVKFKWIPGMRILFLFSTRLVLTRADGSKMIIAGVGATPKAAREQALEDLAGWIVRQKTP